MNDKTQTPATNKQIGSPCLSYPPKEWDKPIFSHQLRFTNINNIVSLDNIPYVIREKDVSDREIFEEEGDGPIMSYGAWHDPTTEDSIRGLKSELQPYKPQEWE